MSISIRWERKFDKNAILFKAQIGTNFIYKLSGQINHEQVAEINNFGSNLEVKIEKLSTYGIRFEFVDICSRNLKLNLQIIDSYLAKILSYALLYKYIKKISRFVDLLDELNKTNPLEYDITFGHQFYEYKLRKFLTDCALGMTPTTLWAGYNNAVSGIKIVKKNGELAYHHIYNRNEFQQYLLNNTSLEQASTAKYKFGTVYQKGDAYFIKLNLQVRFVQ